MNADSVLGKLKHWDLLGADDDADLEMDVQGVSGVFDKALNRAKGKFFLAF